jgi:hypothetical protein
MLRDVLSVRILFALVLITAGLWVDRFCAAQPQPACDNKCRHRQEHWHCVAQYCFRFAYPCCNACDGNISALCAINLADRLRPDCTILPPYPQQALTFPSRQTVCPCDEVVYAEAKCQGAITSTQTVDYYICTGTPPP